MSHKTEAEFWLGMAKTNPGDPGLISAGIAQASATLALVEAQEAANEQARIANLIALWHGSPVDGVYSIDGERGIFQQYGTLKPEIARALGIGGAE